MAAARFRTHKVPGGYVVERYDSRYREYRKWRSFATLAAAKAAIARAKAVK